MANSITDAKMAALIIMVPVPVPVSSNYSISDSKKLALEKVLSDNGQL
jgi:hypothetical protein